MTFFYGLRQEAVRSRTQPPRTHVPGLGQGQEDEVGEEEEQWGAEWWDEEEEQWDDEWQEQEQEQPEDEEEEEEEEEEVGEAGDVGDVGGGGERGERGGEFSFSFSDLSQLRHLWQRAQALAAGAETETETETEEMQRASDGE